ncbi:T-cell activation Rho GTPase-activating protein-like [Calonectris borealis]|uniref:T-cell activation Rho GTPase-activating protein-like n=1 Tax=Calonectris borealis TaxID=1323832 RepID=UPI003F4BD287
MTCSNLAICVGPNLLSPPNEDLLPLEAMLEVTEKVKVLVEFLLENWRELFGEEASDLSCPAAEESPAPTERSRDLHLEEQSGPAGREDKEHQAEAFLEGSLSLLDVLKEAGGDTVLESETGEATPALPPTAPESAASSPGHPEEPASLAEDRREALIDAEPVLSADWRTFSTRSLERLVEGQAEADPKQGPPMVPSSNRGQLCHSPAGGSSRRRRRGLPWPFALRRSPDAAQASGQGGSGCSRALFGRPLAALCEDDRTLPQSIQELLAVLQQEGPATEGIFRRAASGTALRELREALDHGADVELASQPPLLLAVILKDFLRSIPSKLLGNNLYEDWMAAMQRSSKEEKMQELKAVAEKLPGANLLLLKRLLALLQHIGHNAATSRMTCSNLAICVGPNLLSPPNEDLLPLEAMLEVTEKVKVLVEFLLENWRELFGEEASDLSCPAAEESPAPTERSRAPLVPWPLFGHCLSGHDPFALQDKLKPADRASEGCRHLPFEEQSVPAGTADTEHQAEALPHTTPSLLGVLQEAGGDRVVESGTGEAPPALPPTTPESAADSLGHPEELRSLSEDRRC